MTTAPNGIWKTATSVLAAIVVTLVGAWAAIGIDAVTMDEVDKRIKSTSPYVADRKLLLDRLNKVDAIQEKLDKIRDAQMKHESSIGDLKRAVDRLEKR